MNAPAGLANKVPEVTLAFWFIKMMATTVGETAADFLIVDLGFGLVATAAAMGAALVCLLVAQLRRREYVPANYWLAVVVIGVVGTLLSDCLVDAAGVGLETTTAVFSAALAAVFLAWYAVERTLSIHAIVTVRRELFYWVAILVTFALGTAAGNLVAETMNLGFALSAFCFATLIGVVCGAYAFLGLGAVPAFWIAYVLTQPFGAFMGDLLSEPVPDGGLGFGPTGTSILFLTVVAILVACMSGKERHAYREVEAAQR